MLRAVALLILAWMLPLGAHAACSPSTSDANFGSVSSIAVYTTPQQTSTSNSFTCSGGLFSFLTTSNTVYATFNSANNFKLANANGFNVPYNVYASSDYSSNQLVQGQQSSFNFFNFLSVLSSSTGTFNLYYQTQAGANVPAGIYTDTIPVTWTWHICTVGVLVCLAYENGTTTTTIHVTLTVTKACQINAAPNVNFGTQTFIAGFSSVNQSINLTCTLNQPYATYFTGGVNNDGTWNRMKLGSNYLQYNIYVPSTTTVWNLANAQSGIGAGGGTGQNLPYTATMNPGQAEQPAGTYTDNVSITVEF